MSRWHYFTDDEVVNLDTELVAKLDLARGEAGFPFIITSGFRTAADNSDCGGVHDSAHLRGHAVDLHCGDSSQRLAMIRALLAVGFVRLGIYDDHIHVDNDQTLPQNVCWMKDAP